MEQAFSEKDLHQRAPPLCSTVVNKMKQLLDWLNESIRLMKPEEDILNVSDMYRYVAVLLLSHTSGFSFEKTVEILRQAGSTLPSINKLQYIAENVLAFSPTGRGAEGESQWNSQRDKTRQLAEFESLAFRNKRKVFFCPLYLHATLDDDLFGTRASDNQVKMLCARKADKEGHSANAVADALFRVLLAIRFRRRGDTQIDSVQKLTVSLMEGVGEQAVNGCIVTADRGYGKQDFLEILMEHGLGSVFVMPDHLVRVHPFVAASFLNPCRGDLEEELEEGTGPQTGEGNGTEGTGSREEVGNSVPTELESGDAGNTVLRVQGDRRRDFIIDDDPNLSPVVYFTTKSAGVLGSRVRQKKIPAVAALEYGTEKFCRVLCFMYTVPGDVQDALNTWIAMPKLNVNFHKVLFGKETGRRGLIQALHGVVKSFTSNSCDVLTIGQRCADWFVLRQFRVTGTIAGLILMSSTEVQEKFRIANASHSVSRTDEEWFDTLFRSWFSSKVSSKAMMRGTANEDAVCRALEKISFVRALFEVGVVAMKEDGYLACSPDGIAILDVGGFAWQPELTSPEGNGAVHVIANVEIKTRVASTSLGEAVMLTSADVLHCDVGDDMFWKLVPRPHMAQLLHQLIVLDTSFAVYVCAAETGILYTLVIRCGRDIINVCKDQLTTVGAHLVEWAHQTEFTCPAFLRGEQEGTIRSRHSFWWIIDQHVRNNGCFVPLKLFKHAAQTFYSKTKGGVDGATQQRAILRSASSSFKWEQKTVSQTLKTVAINAFFGWRMFTRQDLLESEQTFKSLDNYRQLFNKVQGTADFMFDVSQELLSYASTIQIEEDKKQERMDELGVSSAEVKRFVTAVHQRRRKRLAFFNSEDGVRLRLSVRGHAPKQGAVLYYALCGQNCDGWRCQRTSYRCCLCDVNLCVRVYAGLRKSCCSFWHDSKELKLWSTPSPLPQAGSSLEDESDQDNVEEEAAEEAPSNKADGISGTVKRQKVRKHTGSSDGPSRRLRCR